MRELQLTGMWEEFRAAEVLTEETLLLRVDEESDDYLAFAPEYAL